MSEELYGTYKRDEAMQVAKALNEGHSNDCCEVKWMVEPMDCDCTDCECYKVVRYNHQSKCRSNNT